MALLKFEKILRACFWSSDMQTYGKIVWRYILEKVETFIKLESKWKIFHESNYDSMCMCCLLLYTLNQWLSANKDGNKFSLLAMEFLQSYPKSLKCTLPGLLCNIELLLNKLCILFMY